ncbi:MAG: ABC transporter ATP-binding protein [Erysipelotrichaceae bacterium]|jgi:ABC-2 type transport system ATP-binding protein|nr:ABC transporter ATP-binding protein [Erysipelotrichaceae bacterium]
MNAVIQVENLSVHYRHIQAVKNISFSVKAGEIFAIIGPNGSGKTSTVESMEGLIHPAKGQIRVLGYDPQKEKEAMYRQVGVQLQSSNWPLQIRVKELLKLYYNLYPTPQDPQRLLALLGLSGKKKHTVSKLSGGERQRLSIAIALMGNPKLLILDEVTTGLDPAGRRGIWNILKKSREQGVTTVLVSHYLEEVEALADRLLFLKSGEIAYQGSLEGFAQYAQHTLKCDTHEASLEDLYLRLTEAGWED